MTITGEELLANFGNFYDRLRFERDRRTYERLMDECLREEFPHTLRRCRECDAPFDASAVTSRLFCEFCLLKMD
ncbi:MAG TPA: hypothetical protein PLD20_00790 [Blastocatellia bacterium]|nr:hypothetical protein [Blastocatellia bacterium]HMV81783.1 hypothetical protein [Blastocatellia bacterium]HMX24737.1 hypothetical protein [Blastocatellia bacterium]HMY70682.1 hypothetical protein [Blastocatellia bacterium]HMZ16471.1 hypothetical protein [Blastocatellia bacterium]